MLKNKKEETKVVDEEGEGSKGRKGSKRGGRQKRGISAAELPTDRPLMSISTYEISIITHSAHKNAINVYSSAIQKGWQWRCREILAKKS